MDRLSIYNELQAKFMSVLDQELILSLAKKIINPASHFSGLRQIGQGGCFRVYEINLRDLRCVLKIPQALFSDWSDRITLDSSWHTNLTQLRQNFHELIPPFQNYLLKDTYIQVMPFLEQKPLQRGTFNQLEQIFTQTLTGLNLRNFDTLQIGFYKGIPFALDLSDIRKV